MPLYHIGISKVGDRRKTQETVGCVYGQSTCDKAQSQLENKLWRNSGSFYPLGETLFKDFNN